ncbi:hypothetical protein JAAARDRAFT_349696 [Jaapia argillacea MUCL 33604]|uniref:Uncharacterized protein n=1 Tax=Jaapia argillacea MUCL 33604 TaxID=933084 RepID=A0A067PIR7_9AGAM|nr:hypothetical protein JAAARDRAFT_349696 [Jaapia argillacea MUCL 33604]
MCDRIHGLSEVEPVPVIEISRRSTIKRWKFGLWVIPRMGSGRKTGWMELDVELNVACAYSGGPCAEQWSRVGSGTRKGWRRFSVPRGNVVNRSDKEARISIQSDRRHFQFVGRIVVCLRISSFLPFVTQTQAMNVAALLQDSPSDDRRRPQQLPPQNIQPRQQQQQQQHQPLDRERPQPHPPFHRPSSHLPYPNEYAQSHSHLLPPSPFLNDSYDPAHRTGERGGPRPLNPELLTQPQKLPPHAQQQPSRGHEAYGTLDSRSASSVPLPLRPTPPQHSQHALGPPSALYPHGAPGPPPPDYPSHISHHHERESRMSRSGAPPPAPTTLQLFPTPTLSRSRPRTPPPQAQHSSASGFPGTHSLPAPVSVSTVLSEPSPMYTGPPGPVSSPAMGSLQRPQLPSRHGPQPPSHVQGVTVTSSVTKGIHSVHTRTITPHMEGTPGHGLPPPLLEDIPLRTQAIERRRETERERERGRFSEAALANERERERREVERKDRDLRDEVLLRHHQSVTSSPERHSSGGDRMKRGLEREREREREAREKDIMIERAAARDRERDRLLHHPHHPHHHHHHIHHHHPHSNSSPHNSGLSKPPSGDFPGPPQQLDRYISASESSTSTSAPSQAAHGRPHIHHHPHSHPPPHPHLHPHQHHNHHSLPRPPGVQSHILDLSVPEPIPPPPPPHSRTFPPQPFPPPQPHHSAPPQSQSTAPLPFSFAPQLHRHTPPPLPAPPSSHLPSVPPPLTTSTVPFGIGMGHPPHKPGPSRERFGEVVNLGVYVYPRTPFPFREASEGSATSRVVESEKDKGKLKDLRAELLIPSGFLPDSDGATGLGLKGNGRKRIWGGGLAGPVYAGAYAPRIYTDDSDVFLCALHAGFLTWSGARRALREGLDLRVVVRVLKTVVSPGGGGMPGKFIGGYGAEYIGERGGTGVPSRNVRSTVRRLDEEEEEEESGEDDGRGLLSAGWGNGHDGAGIEILHAEFVPVSLLFVFLFIVW